MTVHRTVMFTPPPALTRAAGLVTAASGSSSWRCGVLAVAVAVGLAAASAPPIGAAARGTAAGPAPAAAPAIAPPGSDRDRPVAHNTALPGGSSSPTRGTRSPARPTSAAPPSPPMISALAANGIPVIALNAYRQAAARLAATRPACGIDWSLLAAIGRVESDHGRFAGAELAANGLSTPRIIGIALDGSRSARIMDTDHGVLDGDVVYDRAVGPMQFIPSTWARWGVDGNGDGVRDPFNVYDATLAAADYLCAAGGNLRTLAGQSAAVLAYNHSGAYLAEVLSLARAYATGVIAVVTPAPPTTTPTLPPVNPAPPPAITRPAPTRNTPAPRSTTSSAASPHPVSTPPTGAPATGSSCPTPASSQPSTSATATSSPTTTAPTTPAPTTPATSTDSTPVPTPSSSGALVGSASGSPTSTATGTPSAAGAGAAC